MKKKKFFLCFCIFYIIIALTYVPKVYAISPAGDQIYQGIDVSNWQGSINFNEVKNDGIEIVYIKASEGTNYVDPRFRMNYEGAKSTGLKIGFYHYVRARSEEQAIKEAQHFVNVIQGTNPDCRLAMDFETFRKFE